MKAHGDISLYRRLAQQARPHWGRMAGIFALDLLSSPLGLLTPLPLKIAVDNAIGAQPLPGFLRIALPTGFTGSRAAALGLAVGLLLLLALLAQLQSLRSLFMR